MKLKRQIFILKLTSQLGRTCEYKNVLKLKTWFLYIYSRLFSNALLLYVGKPTNVTLLSYPFLSYFSNVIHVQRLCLLLLSLFFSSAFGKIMLSGFSLLKGSGYHFCFNYILFVHANFDFNQCSIFTKYCFQLWMVWMVTITSSDSNHPITKSPQQNFPSPLHLNTI